MIFSQLKYTRISIFFQIPIKMEQAECQISLDKNLKMIGWMIKWLKYKYDLKET